MGRKISFKLSVKDIDKAIQEVQKIKIELKVKINLLIEALVEAGVEIAKVQVRELDAIYTGELEESITGFFNPEVGVGIIKTDSRCIFFTKSWTFFTNRIICRKISNHLLCICFHSIFTSILIT